MMSNSPKIFRTYEEQVHLLISRGMQIPDKSFAAAQLETINYYRLSGYWYPFRSRDENGKRQESFVDGTNFDDVLKLYQFDARLRIATFAALSDIELWLRASLGYSLGQISNYAHLDRDSLNLQSSNDKKNYSLWINKYQRELASSKEDFVKHHKDKYGGRLPIWAAVEILDWGALTYLFSFSPMHVKQAIADSCGLSVPQFQSWLKTLNAVRNTAAHHGRLFNRSHALRPKLPKLGQSESIDAIREKNNRTFAVLTLVQFLRNTMGIGVSSMLVKAFEAYPESILGLPLEVTGAPAEWNTLDLWKIN